jgi:hypothetical protein
MTAVGFDPLAIYWIAALIGLFSLWCIYVVISEREYWRGFKAGKRVASTENSRRVNR